MAEIHNQRKGQDPLLKMNFLVEIDGIAVAGFRTCDAPERTWSITEWREGSDPPRNRKQRARESISDITLTRGVYPDTNDLENWYDTGERKSVSIIQLDHLGNEQKRLNCFEAFPVGRKDFDSFDADSEDPNVRSLTIAMEDCQPG